MTLDDLPDDLIVMDCAQCGRLMVRHLDAKRWEPKGVLVCGGRAGGRPYCRGCWSAEPAPGLGGRGTKDDTSPWQENVIRALEDAG